jgi:hypothetical protein
MYSIAALNEMIEDMMYFGCLWILYVESYLSAPGNEMKSGYHPVLWLMMMMMTLTFGYYDQHGNHNTLWLQFAHTAKTSRRKGWTICFAVWIFFGA